MNTSAKKIVVVVDEDVYTGMRSKVIWIRDGRGRLMWRRLIKVLESGVRVSFMPVDLADELILDLARLERELAWFRTVDDFKAAQEILTTNLTNEMKKKFAEHCREVEKDQITREIWITTIAHDPEGLAIYVRTLIELRENEKRELRKFRVG